MKTIAVLGGILSAIFILSSIILACYNSLKDKNDTIGHIIAAVLVITILIALYGII